MAREMITTDDHTLLIQIIAWFLLITTLLSVAARDGTKLVLSKSISKVDDWSIHTALLLAVGQTTAVHIAAKNGLGKSTTTLTPENISLLQKAYYASTLLLNLSLCFSQISVLGFVKSVSPGHLHKKRIYGLGLAICLWTAFNEIGILSLNALSIIDRLLTYPKISWFTMIDVVNIILDSLLITVLLSIIWNIQMKLVKKVSLGAFFCIRIFVIAGSICDIVFNERLRDSDDLVLDGWTTAITTQCVQCVSILTACILYLKPFLMEITRSGFIRNDDLRRRNPSQRSRYSSWGPQQSDAGTGEEVKRGSSSSGGSPRPIGRPKIVFHLPKRPPAAAAAPGLGAVTTITTIEATRHWHDNDIDEWERSSEDGRTRFITRNTTWTVESERTGLAEEDKDL